MTFNSERKLRSGDLSYDCINDIESDVRYFIKNDEEIMKEVKEFCEEEAKEYPASKLTMEDRIKMKVSEMAEEAVGKIRIYCEFDLEVQL